MKIWKQKKQGFALIVVLSALSIIALLAAGNSKRLLTRLTEISTEERIGRQFQEGAALVRFSVAAFGNADGQIPLETRLPVSWLDGEAILYLQDVGGLIDLNTAGVSLIDALAMKLNIPDTAVRQYREWRRTPYRLQSVTDFARVAGLEWQEAEALTEFVTVHSGRFGISADHAPRPLIELIGTSAGAIPEEWQSAPSGSVYEVRIEVEGGHRTLGVVSLSTESTKGRILEIR